MNIYRLTICTIVEYQYENQWEEWFLTEEDMKRYKDKYENSHRRENGKYIPNITDISYYEDIMTLEDAKESGALSVDDFERLFNVDVTNLLKEETDWYLDEDDKIRCSYCNEKSYVQDKRLKRECYCSICGHKMSDNILDWKDNL